MILAPGTYHCLSVWQPWASAIFRGKGIENRSWPAPFRGKLLIHASKNTKDVDEVLRLLKFDFKLELPKESLAFGAIIGMVELYDCKWASARSACGWGADNCYHWHLRNQVLLDKPIPWRGLQRVFPVRIGEVANEKVQESLF